MANGKVVVKERGAQGGRARVGQDLHITPCVSILVLLYIAYDTYMNIL